MHTHRLRQAMAFAFGAALLGVSIIPASDTLAAAKTSAINRYVTGVRVSTNGLTFSAKAVTAPAGLHVEYQFREDRHGRWFIAKRFSASRSFTLPARSAAAAVQAYALTQSQVAHKQWSQAVPSAPVTVPMVRQTGIAVTLSVVAGSTGSDAAAIVNDVVYTSTTRGRADNGDAVTITQATGASIPSSAVFSGGHLGITIGTNNVDGSLATTNATLVAQIQEALSAGSITNTTVALEGGALGSAAPAVSGAGTFAGGSDGTDGVATLTVRSGPAYNGSLAIVVSEGGTVVGRAAVRLVAGETSAAVATAIGAALNRGPFTTDFSVANPGIGVVTLTQLTPSAAPIGVSVSG